MMNNELMFSSKSNEWGTPKNVFEEINKEFNFNLDPCANEKNHKCEEYFTIKDNGLNKEWGGKRVFCNPPYGRSLKLWVKKAYEESKKNNTLIVMLIPARTDTSYFHDYIYNKSEIRFIRGRILFEKDGEEVSDKSKRAPFPSMFVIYNNINTEGGQ